MSGYPKDRLSNKQIRGVLTIAWYQSCAIFTVLWILLSLIIEGISDLEGVVDLMVSMFSMMAMAIIISFFTAFVPAYFLALIYEKFSLRKLWQYLAGAAIISVLPSLVFIYAPWYSKIPVALSALITSYLLWKRVVELRKTVIEGL
jgi:hypothetical protein